MSWLSSFAKKATKVILSPVTAITDALTGEEKPSSAPASSSGGDSLKLLREQIDLQRKQLQTTQQAASAAQRNAAIQAQDTAAQQSMTQANTGAQQALGQQTAYQQALDTANVQSAKSAAAGAGAGQMGAGVNMTATPGKGTAATSGAMISPGGAGAMAGTAAKPTSSFYLPDTSGLQFGGS
jgi:hypothetical protein